MINIDKGRYLRKHCLIEKQLRIHTIKKQQCSNISIQQYNSVMSCKNNFSIIDLINTILMFQSSNSLDTPKLDHTYQYHFDYKIYSFSSILTIKYIPLEIITLVKFSYNIHF